MSHSDRSRKARQRLMREAADLQANPISTKINAQPNEDDIMTWHANIVHMGAPFHFIIRFTHDYPRTAPTVEPCTYISHPNVFGDYICLDILTMSEETEKTPYRGWTPAYTIRSLLIQLQCFLFDVETRRSAAKDMVQQAKDYVCQSTGHSGRTPVPYVECKAVNYTPGFYRCRRAACVRMESSRLSEIVGTIEEQTVVEIVRTEGVRACIRNAEYFEEGWCSAATDSGKLLLKIVVDEGIYHTAKGFTKLFALTPPSNAEEKLADLTEIGSCEIKGAVVFVTGFVSYGSQVLCISTSEDFDLKDEHDQILIDRNSLRFVREIGEQAENVEEHNGVITEDSSWLNEMYGLVLDVVFDMCDSATAHALAQVHQDFQAKLDTCRAFQLRSFRCFYTLKDVQDENTILGVGIKCEVMPKRSRATKRKRDVLQQMHPSFDLMSLEAFEKHNCSTSIWKDVDFNSFMPLYLCPQHGRRALPAAEKCILKMWQMENENNSLSLDRLLETFAKLMNTTIVNMMKNVMDLNVQELQLFDSIKALEGYMSFHHLLLAFTQHQPNLIKLADEKVKRFIEDKTCRDKEVTPNLGELIVMLSISNYKWEDFLPSFLDEVFQRNARWILAKYPGLRNLEDDGSRSCIRLTQSWQATLTGKRLGMFQRFFMKEIACPVALTGNPDKCKILFEDYNSRFGRPVPGIARRLQLHSRKVLAAKTWWDYFDLVGFCAPSSISLSNWLRNSVRLSAAREYHNNYQTLKYTENHVESPNYSLHLNHKNCMCSGGKVFNLADRSKCTTAQPLMDKNERIDVAFVVDCTGSMGSWLSQAKSQITKIIQSVSEKTQFKTIRFALVCYRNHDHMGYWKHVTKSFEFTADTVQAQEYVDSMGTGGGAGVEALSSGFHAAASLKWNKEAMRIIVHIGDQVAHGMGGRGDRFPDGSPLGHDALRIAHNLAKKGVVIYNVDCGSQDGLRQTLYHALSSLTGGVCLTIRDADALANIVVGATMEEEVQNVLSQEVSKIYADVVARHPGAREDQLVYEITHRLKMQKVQVKSILGSHELGKYEQKQVDCIKFCTDLTQVKAMQEQAGEYFDLIEMPKKQFVSEKLRFASEGQVRICLRRIGETLEIEAFRKQGCKYAQKRWKLNAFKTRWEPFKERSESITKFSPWMPLKNNQLLEASRDIKKAGELATKGTTAKNCFNNGRTGIKSSGRSWRTPAKIPEKQSSTKQFAWSGAPIERLVSFGQVTNPLVIPEPMQRQFSYGQVTTQTVSQPRQATRIVSIAFDPKDKNNKLGMGVNLQNGLVMSVDANSPVSWQMGVSVPSRIVAIGNMNYSGPLFTHYCSMGASMFLHIAVPVKNGLQLPVVAQRQTLNVPAPPPHPASQSRSVQRRSGSSSGSPPQRRNSISRTPERSVPIHVVPDLALKITSGFALDVETLKRKFRYAFIFPKEIKIVNQFFAYATFDSEASMRLAARTDLGQDVKVKLA